MMAVFFICLGLPLLDFFFHLDPTSAPNEKRLLAELPKRPENFAGVKKFLSDWEAYFTDHFGCRNVLVMWQNKLKWSLFHQKSIRDVMAGSDGWLFFSAAQMVEHYRGALQFTDQELNDWQKLLEHRRDWLAARGIKYIFVLAPDKQSIYPEFLPAWLRPLAGHTKADQFLAHMKAHSTVEVLDLRPVLLAAKKSAPVYQKTDTHWNELGGFVAGDAVFRALAQNQLPRLAPISLDDFNRSNRPAAGGDMARSLGVNMTESNAVFFTPKPGLPPLDIFIPTDKHIKDMAFAKNPQGRERAVVYHDSFGRFWVPFFGYQFREVDFFWQYQLDGKTIESQNPVVVINEMLERFFNVAKVKELSALDTLP
jgi:alginate O-acetyltransferase complex protein AlgJ